MVEGIVETFLEDGRPVRSVYPNGDEERYHYEDDRLVLIDESPSLWETAMGERQDSGGRLALRYDERGLRSIEGVCSRSRTSRAAGCTSTSRSTVPATR